MNRSEIDTAPFSLRELLTWEFVYHLLFYGIPIGVAAAVLILTFYHHDVQMVEQNLRETEHHHLQLREAIIRQNVQTALADLRFLATMHDPEGMFPLVAANIQHTLVSSFRVFCAQYTHYRQFRTVTVFGRETTRVVCRPNGPEVVPLHARGGHAPTVLAGSYAALAPGDALISGIAAVPRGSGPGEGPTPVVHLTAPLHRGGAAGRAFVVIDVDLRHLISDVMLDTGQGGTMILVESNGRFVRNPSGGEGWGDTLRPGREKSFGVIFPQVWKSLRESDHGVVETAAGLFTFSTLNLPEILQARDEFGGPGKGRVAGAPEWKIVSYVPHDQITAGRDAFARKSVLLIPAPFLVALYLAHVAIRRRRAARALENSEMYLRQIMDSVVDGIVTSDQTGQIERTNAAIVALFGFSSPAGVPRHLSFLLPLESLRPEDEVARLWRGEADGRRLARTQLDLQRQDGSGFPAELVLMEAELGGEARFIWIVRDISERRAFEAKQDAERLRFFHQSKMAEIGLLAAGVIHEVGNPIAAISGMVSQMSEEAEEYSATWPQGTLEKLQMMASHTQRLAGITREISDFVRIRPGEVELFDLNALIRSTARLVAYDARWKQIRLELELDPEIPAIMGIPDQIAQVLMNLLVNAGDAVQERPAGDQRVAVRTENRGTQVQLTVIDNGHGMGEDAKKKAFDSFFTTKPEGKGTGLGLSLCWTILATHHGYIEIESAEGAGATFRVVLPVPDDAESTTG